MHTRRSWLRLAGGVCLVLSLAACGATPVGSTENTPGETPAPATPATTPEAAGNAGLEGAQWQLVDYGPVDAPVPALPQPAVTVKFEAGNRLSGSAGCNSYSGTFQMDGSSFSVGAITSTKMACVDAGPMQQETTFLRALDAATSLQRSGDKLTIDYEGGRLRFARIRG